MFTTPGTQADTRTVTHPYMGRNTATFDSNQTIGGIVAGRPCLTFRPDHRVDYILNVMSHSSKRVAAIVDAGGRFQGLLTRSSLLGQVVVGADFDVGRRIDLSFLREVSAGQVMIANPVILPSELSPEDALTIMTEYGFHTLPVLEDNARLAGMAEMRDLVLLVHEGHRQTIRSQESLLSYFMHHEDYGALGQQLH